MCLQAPHSPLLMEALPQLLQAMVAAAADGQPAELLGRLEAVAGRIVRSYAMPQKGVHLSTYLRSVWE